MRQPLYLFARSEQRIEVWKYIIYIIVDDIYVIIHSDDLQCIAN
jgi:hypothetical protein